MTAAGDPASLLSLDGRVALVSGGAGDIGAAVVAALYRAGARVLSVDLPGQKPPSGGEALDCDLGDPADLRRLGRVLREHEPPVGVFVHCAGIIRDAVLWKMPEEDWASVMRVNLDAAFHLLRAVVPGMRALGFGRVVLVASISGERGNFGQANYAVSKAGLIALGKTAARELGRFGIRVNTVSPGMIETRMTATLPRQVKDSAVEESALGRLGLPEDVARAVLYLCTELSSHVTGQVLRVNGGQYMT